MQTSIDQETTVVLEDSSVFNVTEEALYFLDLGKIWRITPDKINKTTLRFFTVSGVIYHPETQASCILGSTFFVKSRAESFKGQLEAVGAKDILFRYMDVPLGDVPLLST